MVILKSDKEIEMMRLAGRLAEKTQDYVAGRLHPGMTTEEVNTLAHDFILRHNAVPAPLNYKGFPKSICTSINHVVVHGIPGPQKIEDGDIIGVDVTVILDGYYGDMCRTYLIGAVPAEARRLVEATERAMYLGIEAAQPGARLGDIGFAIQRYVEELGFSVVRDFVGHGIGRNFHEEPQVKHYGQQGRGMRLRRGMTFTIEPMINQGVWQVRVLEDGWTAVTADGKLAAQFEHTIAITDDGPEILTCADASLANRFKR
ncbi:MAG: type I methionyl aminopeptidase [Myxococcales bacterium]|nr:type I methionyl aminopeptidase [Myxococcales bacterium]